MEFEWDPGKDQTNKAKHGISFSRAQFAFADEKRIIALDRAHSSETEQRYFCFGRVDNRIATVRFTLREGRIRIIGAAFWREGKEIYERGNRLPEGAKRDR